MSASDTMFNERDQRCATVQLMLSTDPSYDNSSIASSLKYSKYCSTFQVSQVKKAKKWSCKVCGEKQSLTKVYGQGTGTECRHHVQKLNLLRQNADERVYKAAIEQEYVEDFEEHDGCLTNDLNGSMESSQTVQNSSSSKWSKFLPYEDGSMTSQPQREEAGYMEEYPDEEQEIKKIAQKYNKFSHRQKRKNSFLKAHSVDLLPKPDDLMKKPRNTITNYFQLSSAVNQNKSHNLSHNVSVGSRNPRTNLITHPNPINFKHFTPAMDPLVKTSSADTDLLKNKNSIPNSSTFNPPYKNQPSSTEQKETGIETFNNTKRSEKHSFSMDSSPKNYLSNVENSFSRKELLANGHSRTLNIIYGLKTQNVSTHSTEDSYPKNVNNDISLFSEVNKRKTDSDRQMLPTFAEFSKCKENFSEQNISVLKNFDKEKSTVDSCSSGFTKNIFQIDENEIDFDF